MTTRPFEGIRIIDITHVLAGPFAAYQLAVLGADVIKVEHPEEPDQSRESGTDRALNRRNMGTSFLTQGSNKRSITLNLKTEEGRDILKKLVSCSDVLVENYRPGAFEAQGLGYQPMLQINPRLIYCSISAFGQDGVRREQTAYDHVIQATSGIMASTGTEEVNPIKIGAPAIDYATGTMGAFALASALFQRERTGKGQHIDLAMLGVAMMMQASLLTGYFRDGTEPRPHGNKQPFATNSAYDTKEGIVMIGASNIRQQARFWRAIERPDMIKTDNEARLDDRAREAAVIAEILRTRTADEWEIHFQVRHVPAARVRTMAEAIADPHFKERRAFHHFESVPGIDGPVGVPLAAFKFAHGGPSIEHPPHEMGQDTDRVLGELGYSDGEISRLRKARVI
jgi:crotonobetainyl-CoA:carnitine CoA-transferase CaiB-like acyl-CoA transferase